MSNRDFYRFLVKLGVLICVGYCAVMVRDYAPTFRLSNSSFGMCSAPGLVMFPEFGGKSYGLREISPANTQGGTFELYGYSSFIATYNSCNDSNKLTIATYDKNDKLTNTLDIPDSDCLSCISYCMDSYTIITLLGQCVDLGLTRLVYDEDESHGILLPGQNSVVLLPPTDYEHLPKHRPEGPALHVTVSDTDLNAGERFQ